MSQKNKFRQTWKTLTELGQEFGVSAIKFGNLLKENGLREKNGEPSILAKEGGYFEKIEPKDAKSYYLWHREKTINYLVDRGVEKKGISQKEAELMTEARKVARAYLEAEKLDNEGSKMGYLLMDELVDDIKKLGLENFNKALKGLGYKGKEITLEGWD